MPEDVQNAVETSATETPKFTQFDGWDNSGNPIERNPAPKKEESATSAEPAKKAESESIPDKSAAEAEAATKQARKPGEKLSAGEEAAKLRRELREARQELESLRGRPRESEPKPSESKSEAKPQTPQNYAEWRKAFKPTEWGTKYAAENKEATYEDIQAAMADHLYDVRRSFEKAETAREEGMRKFNSAIAEARDAYADFDEVTEPTAAKVNELLRDPEVDFTLKRALVDPDGAHILYALGKDQDLVKKLTTLARTDPAEAIFVWKTLKAQVKAELGKAPAEKQVSERPAEPPKPRAPKPPAEVGGRGAAPEDRAVQAAKTGDFRSFEKEQMARALASR